MYNEKLERLIELALADGELTEKEKQVLFKNAEAEGIDLDEFEIVLEARLFEKTNDKNSTSAAPQSDKLGDIKKCPGCGAIAESFATKCPDCGTEFRNIEVSSSIIRFFEKLDEVEATRDGNFYSQHTSSNINLVTIVLWIFLWPILIFFKGIQFIINKSRPGKWSTTDARKEELVLNYPVPVSKEGILEFLTLSASKINTASYFSLFSEQTKYKNTWNKIWLKKIEQINSKASISMKSDTETYGEVFSIVENARNITRENNRKVFKVLGSMVTLVIIVLLWGSISSKLDENRNTTYASNVKSAEKLIENKKYDEAAELAVNIDDKHSVEIKSKIQLAKLTEQLDTLEPFIQNKEYSKIRLALEKMRWARISNKSDYKTKDIEEVSYRIFIAKKEAINNQLPEKKRADIESIYL